MAIFTIGYSGRKFDDFVSVLEQHGISLVVDIRRFPRSKIPGYNMEALEAMLPRFGVSYMWMGETLGGLRRGGYTKHMESAGYWAGIAKLIELAAERNLALMCRERTDLGCHRRYIAETLASKGIRTIPL